MKKNIRDYKNVGVQYAYILDSIYSDSVDVNTLNDKGKIELVLNDFNACYNSEYEKRMYPNIIDRVAQWLRGLPQTLHVSFRDHDVKEIGKLWGGCKTEKQTAKFVDNWFDTIAFRLIQLAKY